MIERWTELPVVVECRWALAQSLRQWKSYANDRRDLDHDHDLGSGGQLEDKIYTRAVDALEAVEAAADDSAKGPVDPLTLKPQNDQAQRHGEEKL